MERAERGGLQRPEAPSNADKVSEGDASPQKCPGRCPNVSLVPQVMTRRTMTTKTTAGSTTRTVTPSSRRVVRKCPALGISPLMPPHRLHQLVSGDPSLANRA